MEIPQTETERRGHNTPRTEGDTLESAPGISAGGGTERGGMRQEGGERERSSDG